MLNVVFPELVRLHDAGLRLDAMTLHRSETVDGTAAQPLHPGDGPQRGPGVAGHHLPTGGDVIAQVLHHPGEASNLLRLIEDANKDHLLAPLLLPLHLPEDADHLLSHLARLPEHPLPQSGGRQGHLTAPLHHPEAGHHLLLRGDAAGSRPARLQRSPEGNRLRKSLVLGRSVIGELIH